MIDMQTTEDQQQIIEAVSLFLSEKLPVARHRKEACGGKIAPELMKEIAGLGWIGLGVSEESGGHGCTLIDDMLLCREFGRHLAPMSLFSAVVAARLASGAGDYALTSRIIAGECKVGIAVRRADDEAGEQRLVVDAGEAQWIVVMTLDSVSLVSCAELGEPEMLSPADGSVDLSRFETFAGARVIEGGHQAFVETLLLSAAMLVGMAEETRDMAVAYAKEREQFGQPIGAFQAIKHICADAALRAEAAKCLLFFAAIEVEADSAAASMYVKAAKVMAADACMNNGGANIQVHGGTGFTVECDAHLYVKRAHLLEQILGSQRVHQSLLGEGDAIKVAI